MADTGFVAPTTTGARFNNWTDPGNAYASDNARATKAGDGATNIKQSYETFGFLALIPSGATIDGIEVEVEGNGNTGSYNILEAIRSESDGAAFSTDLHFTTHDAGSGVDKTVTAGGAADLWGKTWTRDDFDDANFSVWVATDTNTNIAAVDRIRVKVYYTSPNETFSGTDTISFGETKQASPSSLRNETLTLTDIVSAAIGKFITVLDTISFSERFTTPNIWSLSQKSSAPTWSSTNKSAAPSWTHSNKNTSSWTFQNKN